MQSLQPSFYWQIIDLWPKHLEKTIQKVKKQINETLYRYMTGQLEQSSFSNLELENPHFRHIAGKNDIKVFSLSESPSWVVKTQRPNFFKKFSGIKNKQGQLFFDPQGCMMKETTLAWNMRQVIQEEKLDRLHVIKKYLCSYPFPPQEGQQSKNFFLFEEYVQTNDQKTKAETINHKTLEEIRIISKQLCVLVKKTGYANLHLDNLEVSDRVTLFDTKPMKLAKISQIGISSRLKSARIGLQNFSDSLESYAKRNPGEYQAFRIFQQDCAHTIREIKSEERKLLAISALKVLSCFSIIPIPVYLTLYFLKRSRAIEQTRKALIHSLQTN
nr:hypothetical protein [Parachlamydia sp. AcF125]